MDLIAHARRELPRLDAEVASDPRTARIKALVDFIAAYEAPLPDEVPAPRRARRKAKAKAKREARKTPERGAPNKMQPKILAAIARLNDDGERVTPRAVAKLAGCKPHNVPHNITALIRNGQLVKQGAGKGNAATYIVLGNGSPPPAKAGGKPRARRDSGETTENQTAVLDAVKALIETGDRVSYRTIADLADVPLTSVQAHIRALIAKRLLGRNGSGRGSSYVLPAARTEDAAEEESEETHPAPAQEEARRSVPAPRPPVKQRERVPVPEEAREVFDWLAGKNVDVEPLGNGLYRWHGDRLQLPDFIDRANRMRVIEGEAKFPGGRPKAA